jgi:hypothetical protein
VPHLSSLQNLPPGTATSPPPEPNRRLSYLRDLWHAVQTQEVSGSGALLLLTQMPMDPRSPSRPQTEPPQPPAPTEPQTPTTEAEPPPPDPPQTPGSP